MDRLFFFFVLKYIRFIGKWTTIKMIYALFLFLQYFKKWKKTQKWKKKFKCPPFC